MKKKSLCFFTEYTYLKETTLVNSPEYLRNQLTLYISRDLGSHNLLVKSKINLHHTEEGIFYLLSGIYWNV